MNRSAFTSWERFWFGPQLRRDGTTFHLWAPAERDIALTLKGEATVEMTCREDGGREAPSSCGPGARYAFQLEGAMRVPDPGSRMQDGDVHDPSVVTDARTPTWQCDGWRGRPWEETILYELHTGLLGGFRGVMQHLERLAELGFTAIELMPVADFPGARNWGYDGVLPFAPDRAYGTPDELRQLVDCAHLLGLMVFLDVVYNHFGPDGNYLGEYAPQFFRQDLQTPWGAAIDFRQPMVRRFFIENALYWIGEFRIDGLRLDAVHAIHDPDFLAELAAEIRRSIPPDRHVHLVVENDNNDAQLLRTGFDAQWNDDLHHVLHVLLTGERGGYYADYTHEPAQKLARALSRGFVYQGEASDFRGGARRGSPSADLAPTSFVAFLQNHDQIGNRAFGERLTRLANRDALRAAIALVLLCPQVPLVFMGEEAGAEEPFLYFTDHRPELARFVREGRRNEFAKFSAFSDPQRREAIPDPNAAETFERSRPRFEGQRAREWNSHYKALFKLRRDQIIPRLKGTHAENAAAAGEAAVLARWRLGDGSRLTIAANFGAGSATAVLPQATPIWGEAHAMLPPFSTTAWIEH